MGIVRTGDFVYALRIIKILATPWEKQAAFKQGIIDDKGAQLKKYKELRTSEEKDAYTYLHRIVFNLKRMLEKVPGGSTKLGSATASLLLLKEELAELEMSAPAWAMVEAAVEDLMGEEGAVAGAPTNVTGAPVSTDKPVGGGPMARRMDKRKKKKKNITV